MAKLALFALTLTALIAFSAVSAYRTTTTTIQDNHMIALWDGLDNPEEGQCRRQIPIEQLNHCHMHLTQGIQNPRRPFQKEQQHLQQCCSPLKQVNPQCQCSAIQQVYDESLVQGDAVQMRQMLSKAQRLPNDCRLDVQDCPLVSPRV